MKLAVGKHELVKFKYVNWHGDEHIYVISVESIEFGGYDASGVNDQESNWVMNGHIVLRDGVERRDGHGEPMRRTFLLDKIQDIQDL